MELLLLELRDLSIFFSNPTSFVLVVVPVYAGELRGLSA
jgi:hypothetical protein